MENELLKVITCICSDDGTPKGAGILIDNSHIVTCAHVVIQALKYVPDEETYLGQELKVILFVDGEPIQVEAEVLTMFPQSNVDFAGLRLKTEKPQVSFPVKLLSDTNLSSHSLKVYGFPNGYSSGGVKTQEYECLKSYIWFRIFYYNYYKRIIMIYSYKYS